ncbi:MAG TPA: hypothetical protein DEQ68_07450 [Ruminococcaceae bacterium]|nr:hypothetical protein [Oscillospiraceae bacterium]
MNFKGFIAYSIHKNSLKPKTPSCLKQEGENPRYHLNLRENPPLNSFNGLTRAELLANAFAPPLREVIHLRFPAVSHQTTAL